MTIEFHNVSFSYSTDTPVLQNMSAEIGPEEIILIAGHNGAGKSTLLRLLNGMLLPTDGTTRINGIDTRTSSPSVLARTACITFQNPAYQIFASTVRAEAEFGPKNLRRPDPHALAQQALQLFQLEGHSHLHPYDLTLANRKLLTLASAVATDAHILAFDEPSVNLSQPERSILLDALSALRERKHTVLIVSHDLELFLPLCTKVLLLHRGTLLFFGRPEEVVVHQTILRRSGVRFTTPVRLRPYCGLHPIPQNTVITQRPTESSTMLMR